MSLFFAAGCCDCEPGHPGCYLIFQPCPGFDVAPIAVLCSDAISLVMNLGVPCDLPPDWPPWLIPSGWNPPPGLGGEPSCTDLVVQHGCVCYHGSLRSQRVETLFATDPPLEFVDIFNNFYGAGPGACEACYDFVITNCENCWVQFQPCACSGSMISVFVPCAQLDPSVNFIKSDSTGICYQRFGGPVNSLPIGAIIISGYTPWNSCEECCTPPQACPSDCSNCLDVMTLSVPQYTLPGETCQLIVFAYQMTICCGTDCQWSGTTNVPAVIVCEGQDPVQTFISQSAFLICDPDAPGGPNWRIHLSLANYFHDPPVNPSVVCPPGSYLRDNNPGTIPYPPSITLT